jgi:tetratricopeptide (TPR) repeat protein
MTKASTIYYSIFIVIFLGACTPSSQKKELLLVYDKLISDASSNQEPAEKRIALLDSACLLANQLQLRDSSFYHLYYIKSNVYIDSDNADSALLYINKMDSLASINQDSLYVGLSQMLLGRIQLNKGNVFVAEKYYFSALRILEKQNDPFYLARIYNYCGTLLYDKGEYKESQKLLLKCYEINRSMNDSNGIASTCINLANNYMEIGSNKEALSYYHKALQIAKKIKNLELELSCYNDLGIINRKTNPDSALFYYKLALKSMPRENAYIMYRIKTEYNLANIYVDKKQLNMALPIYKRLLAECESRGIGYGQAIIYSGLSAVYSHQNKFQEAITSLQNAIDILEKEGASKYSHDIKKQLKETYQEIGDYKNALLLSDVLKNESDSLNSYNKQLAIHDMELYYQSEKIKLENAKLNAEVQNNKLNLILRMIIILFLLISIISMVVVFQKKNKMKQQIIKDLEEKNEIERQLKETKANQSEWFRRIIKQQQNEWLQLSKENEEIRHHLSGIDNTTARKDNDEVNSGSKKTVNQLYRKNMMQRFNLMYPDFTDNLKNNFSTLTEQDILFCILVKTNIPMLDIASILNTNSTSLTKRRRKIEEIINSDGSVEGLYKKIQEMN